VVYAGTYNEHVTVTAGAAGAYKTLQVNGTDAVYVYDFTLNSHTKVSGFKIQNPSAPASRDCIAITNNATDIYITGNNMYACGYHAMISGVDAEHASSYVFIQNNTLSYPCSTSAAPNVCMGMLIKGNYHLIENNDMSHMSDGIALTGSYNIIRNNTFHDTSVADCGSRSSNCHIDFIDSEPLSATQYNVIEGNTILNNIGDHGHAILAQGDYCGGQCYGLIIRFNTGAHVGSAGILNDNAGNKSLPGFSHVKSYNNTWVDFNKSVSNQMYGGTNAFTNNSRYGSQINELFYYPQAMGDFNPYTTDSTTASTFSVRNNLAYCNGVLCNLHGIVYGSGLFTADSGNIKADPKFVNYAANDFRLAAGSPASAAGTYLTTVAAGDSGSGTSLIVTDASFFQDGYSMAGVKADCIAVGTVSNRVCVSSVDYRTNTITLSSPITRSPGAPVWLYSDSTGKQVLSGSAPNIGATTGVMPPANNTSSCDVNRDGQLNNVDVQAGSDQVFGTTACGTADIDQNGACNVIDLQRVIYAMVSGTCVVGQ
jgi:parallel beta-helix repeat protein